MTANGTGETYVLQDAGRRLRTVGASGCDAPPGAACLGILTIHVYEVSERAP